MQRNYIIFGILGGIILLLSFSANPPNGHTNAPNEGVCWDCHTLNGGMQNGNISITGLPATITPNTAYTLTMTSSNPNGIASLAGFQLTILNDNNQIAGSITSPSAGSTVQSSGGRQYWEHNPAQPYPMSNVVMWTATWTSPSMPPNTVITAYAAGNIANGNGFSTGDLIVTTTASGMLEGGGSELMVDIITFTDVSCFGESDGSATADATGGTPPYTYNWSSGATGATANNLAGGTYTVTATDNTGATATASVTISEPPELFLNTPNIVNNLCNGDANGSIIASASGGVGPYFYEWSTGATGASIFNLSAGSYTVTVTDDNACTASATYMVTEPAPLVINLVDLNHETCAGAEDGSITISTSGGTNPVFAEWSNGSIGFTVIDLAPDTYNVTVTDNNNCTATASFTINAGGTVEVELLEIQHVSCFGGADGALSVTASGGNPPYTYLWSNGMSGASITGLAAGSYLVTVTDMNDCVVVEGYTISQPSQIVITINETSQNACAGDSTADLTAVVSGGTPGYSFQWSNGATGMDNFDLTAGVYTVTVTDMNNCTATASATIVDPLPLVVSVMTTHETAAGANDGTATAIVTGGTGPFMYSWSQGATSMAITNLPPGMYCVTVTDNNGCTAVGCGQVNQFGCTLDVTLPPDVTICEGDSSLIIPVVTGGTGVVSFLWSDGSTGPTLQITAGGMYCLTVTDETSCQDSDCMLVTENTIAVYDCPVMHESVPGANDGAINCDSFPNIVSFQWSNGAITSSISGLSPGQYCVTVTDVLGCTKEQCFTVQAGNCNLIVTHTQMNVLCAGDSTGTILVSVTGATEPVTYTWGHGSTGPGVGNLPAGNYVVTIMDAAGCVETLEIFITEPDPLTITIDSIAPLTDTEGGLVHITAGGGVPPYTYMWLDPIGTPSTNEDLNDLDVSGFYEVTVTDANGCTTTVDSIFVDNKVSVAPGPKFKTLKVYPVPADDYLVIDLEDQIQEIIISGIDGRLYKRIIKPASNRIEISDLEAGWYVVRIFEGENWFIARLVK